ncbi:hypothetical protein SDC9_64526 [bioreactor metagenome]|uniref:Uncharacterized protein n=1 Tax=bioreactor metagenome TaxID=1076179 RepID=A0A644XPI7_9ZZZZ
MPRSEVDEVFGTPDDPCIVGGDHRDAPTAAVIRHEVVQSRCVLVIQRGRRLVHEEYVWLPQRQPDERDPLLLATTQARGGCGQQCDRQTETIEDLLEIAVVPRESDTTDLEILADRPGRHQSEVLEQKPDGPPKEPPTTAASQCGHVGTADDQFAAGHLLEAAEALQKGGLACTTLATHGCHRARLDLHIQVAPQDTPRVRELEIAARDAHASRPAVAFSATRCSTRRAGNRRLRHIRLALRHEITRASRRSCLPSSRRAVVTATSARAPPTHTIPAEVANPRSVVRRYAAAGTTTRQIVRVR